MGAQKNPCLPDRFGKNFHRLQRNRLLVKRVNGKQKLIDAAFRKPGGGLSDDGRIPAEIAVRYDLPFRNARSFGSLMNFADGLGI